MQYWLNLTKTIYLSKQSCFRLMTLSCTKTTRKQKSDDLISNCLVQWAKSAVQIKLPGCRHSQVSTLVVVLPDPFRGIGAWKNSTETQQSCRALRSRPEVKNGRSSAGEARMRDSQGGGESDPPQALHEEFSFRVSTISKNEKPMDCPLTNQPR